MTNWKRVVLIGGTVGLLMGLVVGQARGGDETPISQGQELYCMAEAIYFESGNQPFVGKMAVAEVILNRVQHIGYPDTVCDVVHQGPVRESWKTKQNPDLPDSDRMYYPIKWKCQFTYYCDGKSDEITESETWEESLSAAYLMYDGRVTVAEGATHYHATYVKPHWASQLRKVVQIEDHVFYK